MRACIVVEFSTIFVRARICQLVMLAGVLSLSTAAQDTRGEAGREAVKLLSIHVKGSRLPEESILRLAGLEVGQVVDEARLRKALERASESGLFNNIAYNYESAPGTTDVSLELVVTDQRPLVPATISIENIDSEKVWEYLLQTDPLFKRELPPTESAIKLYETYINKYLRSVGQTDISVSGSVTGSNPRFRVIFEAVRVEAHR